MCSEKFRAALQRGVNAAINSAQTASEKAKAALGRYPRGKLVRGIARKCP